MDRAKPFLIAAVLALSSAAGAAQAQTAQNGNVYNGTAHEPNPGATQQQEQSAGIALPPAQQQQTTNTVEQLDRQIQQQAATPTGTAAGCTANQKACPP